ncbi:MAG: RluA family pseudouridine synthase [Proteocatella sp.]
MWPKELQEYNKLVWVCEGENTLKSELLNKMDISVRMVCNLKKNKTVNLNGRYVPMHTVVKSGDLIEVFFEKEGNEYISQNISIEILYEDCDLLVVEKPYGMVVHPTRNHLENTMLNAIKYYFESQNIKSKVRFVNRLDRDTSGILIVAKNSYAHSVLTKDTSMWDMDKKYAAVVEGELKGEATIDMPIMKSDDGIKRIVDLNGQKSITHYKVVKSNEKASLLELELETGRTHQIRVHMAHIGHPLFGDELYGGNIEFLERQALHCIELGFYSPRKMEKIVVKTKPHEDIMELISKLSLN